MAGHAGESLIEAGASRVQPKCAITSKMVACRQARAFRTIGCCGAYVSVSSTSKLSLSDGKHSSTNRGGGHK